MGGPLRIFLLLFLVLVFTAAVTSLLWYYLGPRYDAHHSEAKTRQSADIFDHLWLDVPDDATAYHREIVRKINEDGATWKAKFNPSATIESDTASQGGEDAERPPPHKFRSPPAFYSHGILSDNALPRSFDARQKWPFCVGLQKPTPNQGACGSCWAIAATSTMSDRICIHSRGKIQVEISTIDLMSCLTYSSCTGGLSHHAFMAWLHEGIVSGGDYGTTDGCKPYVFSATCGGPCSPDIYSTQSIPACEKRCHPGSRLDYGSDRYKGKQVYLLAENDTIGEPGGEEKNIRILKTDLYQRGPATGCFLAYEDLLHYSSGVYTNITGDLVYGHCVKIIGWGVEEGIEYWLIANSWGTGWGMRGFAKFKLADYFTNGESITGMPDLDPQALPKHSRDLLYEPFTTFKKARNRRDNV